MHRKTKASMIVYVDDMLMLAAPRDVSGLRREFEKAVNFKDPEASLARYLGAQYKFADFVPKRLNAARSLSTDMDEYAANAVRRFKDEYRTKLHHVTSAYLSPEELAILGEQAPLMENEKHLPLAIPMRVSHPLLSSFRKQFQCLSCFQKSPIDLGNCS